MQTSVKDLKNNLSAYLKKVCLGEALIITSHNHAIARLVPLTGGEMSVQTNRADFVADIHQLHQKLRKIKLKKSMLETVLEQRNQDRS